MSTQVRRLITNAVLVPLVLMAVLSAVLAWQVSVLMREASWVDHTDQVIAQANRAQKLLLEMEINARGYLLTTDARFLQSYEDARASALHGFDRLAELTHDNREQAPRVDALRARFREWLALAQPSLDRLQPGSPRNRNDSDYIAEMRARKDVMDSLRASLLSILDTEEHLREERATATRNASRVTGVTAVVVLVLVAGLLVFITRRNMQVVTSRFEAALTAERISRETAEGALHLREEFLQMASHELKTPITSLRLQLESLERQLLRRGSADVPRVQHKLGAALRQLHKLQEIVTSLLDVQRMTATGVSVTMSDVDASMVVRDVLAQLDHELQESGCPLSVEVPERMIVRADPTRLAQVVANLLTNAVKYGRGKPVSITLHGEGTRAQLCVRDEGIGISEEDQSRIFQRFERAVSADDFHGFGLGLWIVRSLVEKMGGSIRVESALHHGATFFVDLVRTEPDSLELTSEHAHGAELVTPPTPPAKYEGRH